MIIDKKLAGSREPQGERPGTATRQILAEIRQMIVSLELPPGSVIDRIALCDRFGVSRQPVSEALARLQLEGLVDIRPQSGTRVGRISMADVRQAMFIRRSLEVEMVRSLIPILTDECLGALGLNLQYQDVAIQNADPRAFHDLDLAFHDILLDLLGFVRVKAAVDAARGSLERARRLLSSRRRHTETLAEHIALHRMLQNRDADGAAQAMTRHLDAVLGELAHFAAAHPEIIEADGNDGAAGALPGRR